MRAVLCLLFSLVVTGCGVTGNTSRFVVDVRSEVSKGPISVTRIDLEPDQSRLVNVGTYAWGKYDAADLENLTQSMKESAKSVAGPSAFGVHVVVRRFLVATGGSDGIAIACVAWALTSPEGKIAYHEQFYASRHVNTFGTVGGIKDTVHEAISKRVLGRAAAIAAQPGTNVFESVKPVNAFDTYEEAVAGLPASLTAASLTIVQLGNGYSYMVIGKGATETAGLAWVQKADHLDWNARLGLAP